MIRRYLRVPEDISLSEGVSCSFAAGVTHIIDHSSRFSRPQSAVRSGLRIINLLADQAPGAIVELAQDDWQMLYDTIEQEAPAWGSWQLQLKNDAGAVVGVEPFIVAPRKFLPFANAVADASHTHPEETKP